MYEFEQICSVCKSPFMARDTRAGTPLCHGCAGKYNQKLKRQFRNMRLDRPLTQSELQRLITDRTVRI